MRPAIALSLLVVLTTAAGRQAPERRSRVDPSDYANCALWVEQGRLRRGMHTETVTRLGFFSRFTQPR